MRWVVGVIVAVTMLPGAAQAHWQNTRWGMTEAEVRGLWPSAQERAEGGFYLLRIDTPTQIGAVTYKSVRFIFDTKGKLREVRLDTSESFDVLRERMASQMGAPVSEEDERSMLDTLRSKRALFRDLAKGNSVSLFSLTGGPIAATTTLTYRPVETGF